MGILILIKVYITNELNKFRKKFIILKKNKKLPKFTCAFSTFNLRL